MSEKWSLSCSLTPLDHAVQPVEALRRLKYAARQRESLGFDPRGRDQNDTALDHGCYWIAGTLVLTQCFAHGLPRSVARGSGLASCLKETEVQAFKFVAHPPIKSDYFVVDRSGSPGLQSARTPKPNPAPRSPAPAGFCFWGPCSPPSTRLTPVISNE